MSGAAFQGQAASNKRRRSEDTQDDAPVTKSSRCDNLEGDTPGVAADLEYLHDVELQLLQSHDDDPVTHIAHISDVHIRRNSRFEEYEHVFAHLYEGLRELKLRHPGSIAVIAGDVVHEKCNMHSNGADTAWGFFKSLSNIMPIVVIPGNHDGQVRNTSAAKNTLSTLLRDRTGMHPIHLLVPSGAYVYSNVVFGVSSIFDGTFVKAESIANLQRCDMVKIALYHGAVPQVVSAKVFQGYDLTLLGDIHKHQYLNSRQTMAYPGSLISQDFGETDDDHGWIEWDLMARKPTYHRVPNDYAHKTIDFIQSKIQFNGTEYDDAESIVNLLPKKAHLRIMYKDDLMAVKKFEKSLLDALPDLTIKKIPVFQESVMQCPSLLTTPNPRDLLNQPELHSFIATCYSLTPAEVNETIKALNKELKKIDNHGEFGEADWSPLVLTFSHLYGYGRGNVIDFTRLKDNGVVGLFAPNTYGKSSVLDILSIAMFGKTTSEGVLHYTVINETQTRFNTSLLFSVGGSTYFVIRTGDKVFKTEKPSMKKTCRMYHVVKASEQRVICAITKAKSEEIYSLMGKKDVMVEVPCGTLTETEKAIEKLVGSYDGFRLSSMCLQTGASANSLLTMQNADKKEALMKLFKLDVFQAMHGAVKSKLRQLVQKVEKHDQSLKKLNNPEPQLATKEEYAVTVEENLKSIGRQIKELETEETKASVTKHDVPADKCSITVVKEKLAALDTDVLVTKMKAVSEKLAAVEKQEAELLKQDSELTLLAERSILKDQKQFESSLEKLQIDAENVLKQKKPLYTVSYDSSKHQAVMKKFEELERQLQAMPSNIKGLKFSDECECCKHNRHMLGEEDTGTVLQYSEVKEQLDKMERYKKLFEENQKSEEHNQMVDKQLQAVQMQKKEVKERIDKCHKLLEQHKKQQADLMEQKLSNSKRQTELVTKQHRLDLVLAEEKNIREELQKTLVHIEHNRSMDEKIKWCQNQLKLLREKHMKINDERTKLIGELTNLRRNVDLYRVEMKEHEKANKEMAMYKRLEYITNPKNGYSLHMLKQYIPQMCQAVNSIIYLYMDRQVDMTLDGETINLLSIPRERGESPGCPISSFSGMEWFMVDVAIKIVLGKMARVPRSGLMFIDEGISVMDQDRMARIGDLFDFLRGHFRYTFVISHIDTVEDRVDTRLCITKEKCITKEGQFSKINNTEPTPRKTLQ